MKIIRSCDSNTLLSGALLSAHSGILNIHRILGATKLGRVPRAPPATRYLGPLWEVKGMYSYTRYLAAKKSIDDRALNKDVVEKLRGLLPRNTPLRVLEIGAGLGTMVARAQEWQLLSQADYTLLDVDAQLLSDSRQWLSQWAQRGGLSTRESSSDLHITGPDVSLTVRLVHSELGDYLQGAYAPVDLLIANAFLDLVEVPVMLPKLFQLVKPGGLCWFSINFDGDTIFEPHHPADSRLMASYHASMDERVRYGRPAGHSQTGRRLFHQLSAAGAAVLAAGSSDWLVLPQGAGGYPGDEAYFLHHILSTVEEALSQRSEVDQALLNEWLAQRRGQVDRSELVYVAHQLDFLARPSVVLE